MTDTDASTPGVPASAPAEPAGPSSVPAIGLNGVAKEFHSRGEVIAAVRGIDLTIRIVVVLPHPDGPSRPPRCG
jgi:hypothetical protein